MIKRKRRIAVVEDDPFLQRILKILLRGRGFEVSFAHNAAGALSMLRNIVPDLVLMDVCVPGANGFQIVERMRQDPALRRVAVIFLTGSDVVGGRARASRQGACEFIEKPYEPRYLLAAIDRAMARKSGATSHALI